MSKPRQQASDSVTLLLSLVPYLSTNSPVSVNEAAEHFQVSAGEITSAIDFLVHTGIPDLNGFLWTGDMFDMDFDLYDGGRGEISLINNAGLKSAPRLSAREAAAISAGLGVLRAAAPRKEHAQLDKLIAKIALGLADVDVPVRVNAWTAPQAVQTVLGAIEDNRQLSFNYLSSSGKRSERVIDPVRIDYVGHAWFVRGWCHERSAMRTFRADRVTNLEVSDAPRCDEHVAVKPTDEMFSASSTDIVAIVEYPIWSSQRFADFAPKLIGKNSNVVTAEIRFSSTSKAIQLVARNAGLLIIREPQSLRDDIAHWALSAR